MLSYKSRLGVSLELRGGCSGDTVVKNTPADAGVAGDMGLTPGLGRFP